jgi:hypothetical protein
MKKESFEKLNDSFINLYKQGIFIRCYEYSAILISEITWYRVYPNVDKKTGFVYLELWFPVNKQEEIIRKLEVKKYNIRLIDSEWNIEETIWIEKIDKNNEKLTQLKKWLIKFT